MAVLWRTPKNVANLFPFAAPVRDETGVHVHAPAGTRAEALLEAERICPRIVCGSSEKDREMRIGTIVVEVSGAGYGAEDNGEDAGGLSI